MPEIWFPHLNIEIDHLDKIAFNIFGASVAWYGIFIGSAFLLALWITMRLTKSLNENRKTQIDPELYYDALVYIMILAIIGARLYYVIFDFSAYKDDLSKIFEVWNGGLAFYGGVIGGIIAVIYFTKKKNLDFFEFSEPMLPALALGQALGRWGNFVNREAYGRFTDNIFAMRILREDAPIVTQELLDNLVVVNGTEYIQVHPTFLYESLLNIINFCVLVYILKNKKFKGQVILTYMIFYGAIRTFTEGLRVDQLQLGNGWAVSRILSMLLVIVGVGIYIYKFKNLEVTNDEKDEIK